MLKKFVSSVVAVGFCLVFTACQGSSKNMTGIGWLTLNGEKTPITYRIDENRQIQVQSGTTVTSWQLVSFSDYGREGVLQRTDCKTCGALKPRIIFRVESTHPQEIRKQVSIKEECNQYGHIHNLKGDKRTYRKIRYTEVKTFNVHNILLDYHFQSIPLVLTTDTQVKEINKIVDACY